MIVWTRQVASVLDTLQRDGIYTVKEEYVRTKNGDISDYYLELYRWLTAGCRSLIDVPKDCLYPVWLSLTESGKLGAAPGTVILTLDVPDRELFIMDDEKWGCRENYWYIPKDSEDEKKHEAQLRSLGIANESLLFSSSLGNYYPALKQKIARSWSRIFSEPSFDMNKNVGLVWRLKKEWIIDYELTEDR